MFYLSNQTGLSVVYRVVTGANDGKIRVWDLATEQCLKIFRGNSLLHPVTGLAFDDHFSLVVNTSTSIHLLNFANTDEEEMASKGESSTTASTSDRASAASFKSKASAKKLVESLGASATKALFAGTMTKPSAVKSPPP